MTGWIITWCPMSWAAPLLTAGTCSYHRSIHPTMTGGFTVYWGQLISQFGGGCEVARDIRVLLAEKR